MPRVSIVIPTHNRAEFLGAAVRSVLCQSFQDFEVVIVDDGSNDCTSTMVDTFRDERIHYIRHRMRRGGAAARNTGIARASGEYVAFLDDDDEWFPEKLERQMNIMLASPPQVGGVYTGYFIVNRSDGSTCGQVIARNRGYLYPPILAENLIGGTSSVVLRRACLERVGWFDETLPSFQDYDLWIRVARGFEFECIPEPLLKYFVHPHQVWTNLDALVQGLEVMLKKYGAAPAFRKKAHRYFLSFGVRFCERNQFDRGRKAFMRAAAMHPYGLGPYFYFCLAFLGRSKFDKARKAKTKLLTGLRKFHSFQGLRTHA